MRGWAILFAVLAAGTARAECTVSGDPGAAVHAMSTSEADTSLVISMSMLPKLLHLDYAAAAKKAGCDLGPLGAGHDDYALWGDDGTERSRKAIPAKKGEPIALVLGVVDLMKAIEASKTHTKPTIEGYLLATVTKTDLTGWRFYTAMPDTPTLKHDMAEVLAGAPSAIFRNGADGKTYLYVPKG